VPRRRASADDRKLERLCRAALGGDVEARGRLLDESTAIARGVTAAFVRDEGDEVVQTTLIRVHRGLDTIDDASRFRAWLVAVALNAARDHLRRKRRERGSLVIVNSDLLSGQEDGRTLAPEAQVAAVEEERRLRAELQRLPEATRRVFELILDEGLDVAAIAKRLQVSESAVWSRIHRGREQLRRARDGGGGPE